MPDKIHLQLALVERTKVVAVKTAESQRTASGVAGLRPNSAPPTRWTDVGHGPLPLHTAAQ